MYKRKLIPSYCLRLKSNEVEAMLTEIQIGQIYISLLSEYKLAPVNFKAFTDEMYTLLELAFVNQLCAICSGNLNCDILHPRDNGNNSQALLDTCDIYDEHNLI